ncbi:hypothetical protein I4U23_018520 [Adineta vaga]|nr:hypothetical protein I4U23_018520 [Adineta vaga]
MGRKSNAKDHLSSEPNMNQNDGRDPNDLYRKRLRSWKRSRTEFKTNQKSIPSIDNPDVVLPLQKSTIYTYPMKFNNTHQCIQSNTRHLESSTTESAFLCPSISNTSIQTMADVNNNHVTVLNIEKKKRKYQTSSCESLTSRSSQTKTRDVLLNVNNARNSNILQQTCISVLNSLSNYIKHFMLLDHSSSTKQLQFSTNDSIITLDRFLNSSLPMDNDTIDINQLDPHEISSSSLNNESLVSNTHSMEAAVKMVQPIVDIIFNAFEDQLKTVSTNAIHTPSTSQLLPLPPSTCPVVLHAVNFNIQLTTKQNSVEQYLPNTISNENNHLQSSSSIELKRRLVDSMLSNNSLTHLEINDNSQRRRHKLKRLAQLAVFGVSVLCGYLLM